MPTGSADEPCLNANDGEHLWYHNALLGRQCSACGASRPYDPERDPPLPSYKRRRGRRGGSRRRPRKREPIFADEQPEGHRNLRVAGQLARRSDPSTSKAEPPPGFPEPDPIP